jgi:SAM-dependent methyltransferase
VVGGYNVTVNRDSHQQALDLAVRPGEPARAGVRRSIYDLPYRFGRPRRVLVIGAGTGNDVAAALRASPDARVDAVEIDPRIAQLGRELHPERPYDSPNVRVHIDDARAYLTRTDERYDTIVFGFLDSHRLFSHMSSVRLDNYVYTTRSLETVRDRLTPDGVMALTFTVHEKWIADRLYGLVERAFGHPPLVYDGGRGTGGTMFINSPSGTPARPSGVPEIASADFRERVLGSGERVTWNYVPGLAGFIPGSEFTADPRLPTDEWPYLYMREPAIPPNYLEVLLLTLAAATALVWLLAPRVSFRRPSTWNFFALGAAFALLETRAVTEIGLVLGSTWTTNAVVISSILTMILVANLVATRFPRVPLPVVYGLLLAALVFNYLVSLRATLNLSYGLAVLVAALQVGLPLLLSGIVFARSFARAEDTGSALGANLMGAVLGALLEYSSLLFGLRELYLLALAFYVVSFLIVTRGGVRAGRGVAAPGTA